MARWIHDPEIDSAVLESKPGSTQSSAVMPFLLTAARYLIAGVWIFHGLYSKLLGGIPRHEKIVARILGDDLGQAAIIAVGVVEICLGIWVLTGRRKVACAITQTLGIAFMNTLEILLARDLLISAPGMVALNAAFLALVWWWALRAPNRTGLARRP
jgi:uncharacterized membrane protein YphA (DoxX/SURF4 family)